MRTDSLIMNAHLFESILTTDPKILRFKSVILKIYKQNTDRGCSRFSYVFLLCKILSINKMRNVLINAYGDQILVTIALGMSWKKIQPSTEKNTPPPQIKHIKTPNTPPEKKNPPTKTKILGFIGKIAFLFSHQEICFILKIYVFLQSYAQDKK